jgi:uncharacterized membrane protein
MRTVRLAVPALAITLISAIMFRQGFVFFGILHLLAISSILAWPFLGKPVLALATGMAILAGGLMLGNQRFDWPYLAWLGFRPEGWYPVDYLPLLPWFAWCLFGTAARDLLLQHGLGRSLNGNSYPSQSVEQQPPTGLDTLWQAAVPQFLIYTGRHSLPIYLIHLPVLYGLASLFALLSHP